jgi:hypothetical protein
MNVDGMRIVRSSGKSKEIPEALELPVGSDRQSLILRQEEWLWSSKPSIYHENIYL